MRTQERPTLPPTTIERLQAKYVMQCWAAQKNYAPIEAVRAQGCWITTADGRRIFDLRSAHECINLGFNHPHVLSAMKAQMDRVIYVTDDFATAPAARLARRLSRLAPGDPDKKVFFSQSGAAAVEAAIKGARLYQYQRVLGRRLAKLARHHPCIGDVRGLGLFWTLELVLDSDQKTPLRPFTDKYCPNIMQRISRYLLEEKNIYIPGDKFGVWVVPPLVVSEDEIEWLAAALDDALYEADAWIGCRNA